MAALVPLGEVADEQAHVLRADSLLHGEIVEHRHQIRGGKAVVAGVDANPALLSAASPFPGKLLPQKKLTPGEAATLKAIPWNKNTAFFNVRTIGLYLPIFYVPAAAAIEFARIFHLSPYDAVLSARMLNALCFSLIGVCALLLARRGRMLLFCVLALPMTISLGASVNEDGLLIATSALAFGLLTRAKAPHGPAYWTAAALIAVIAAVKIPYVPLVFLLLIPCGWQGRFKKPLRTGLRTAALAAAPGILWAAAGMLFIATPFVSSAPYHPGYLWPGNRNAVFDSPDISAQAEVFLHRPLYPIVLPIKTLEVQWPGLRDGTIGILGWLDLVLPREVYNFWMLAVGCAILSDILAGAAGSRAPPWAAIGIGLLTVFGTLCALFDAEYLTWSHVGAPLIEGIQGRYLLLLLAALAVCLPAVRIRGAARLKVALAAPAFAMAAFGMVFLPSLIVSTYYLR
ncbi:MAG: DUF2142 domain-containing protein [Candidatus Acidiferrales bacterium]